MPRTKLKRIMGVKELKNVFSLSDDELKNSLQKYFKPQQQITLEIGCGSGEYSVELASKFPQRNFIGLDVKAARIFNGASKAIDLKLNNVAFVIAPAKNLVDIFAEKSIEEIYIPFPDPHPRRANQNRRLISPYFLEMYRKLLIDQSAIHFKTDNKELYDYALKTISEFGCKIILNNTNLYQNSNEEFALSVKTSFESHYLRQGRHIRYICVQF
jgi:tRNA (guanine-N7-)-methyltransferase